MTITNTYEIAQWISLLQLPTNYNSDQHDCLVWTVFAILQMKFQI
jgi:hypothetical protein